jgi:hypothetical protein
MAYVCLLCACGPSNTELPNRDGDAELFVSQVQPILARHCAFLGCHGREGMPLSIYAVNYSRLRDPEGRVDNSRPPLDEQNLTATELEHNRKGLAARVGTDDRAGDIERFLTRLISLDQGSLRHAGVVVFDRPDDPELATLRAFLETVR